jgi:hypothetical protein
MGLFSRKKTITVSSTTINLAGDDTQQDYLKSTITNAAMHSPDIAGTINTAYLKGMGTQIRLAYWYGRDYFSLGLPDGSIYYGVPNNEALLDVLSSLNGGKQVSIVMADFNVADLSYWIEQYLTEEYDWDSDYGGMGNPPSGVPPTAAIDYTIDNNAVVTINMGVPPDILYTETKTFPGINYGVEYYQVIYRVRTPGTPTVTTETRPYEAGDTDGTETTEEQENDFGLFTITVTTVETAVSTDMTTTTIKTTVVIDSLSRKQYFMYEAGTGVYPTLDTILDDVIRDSAYYPIVPLRVNNKDLTDPANVSPEQLRTSKTLLNKLNLKFTMLGDKLNENPDVDQIDHAFFVMGISLNSEYESSIDYLHEFFKYLAQVSPSDREAYLSWYAANVDDEGNISNIDAKPPVNRLSLKQDPYNISIAYQYCALTVKNGSIGPLGTVTRTQGVAQSIDAKNPFNASVDMTVDVSTIIFRKQISATQYEEVETCGLEHINSVYKGHTVNLTGEKSLSSPDNEGFLIPLCVNIVEAQQIVKRTQMTFDCLHIVVNSYDVTKAKWYQTGLFKVVTIIIAVVIAVWSAGTLSAGVAAAAAGATAAGTSVAVAVAIYIATQVAIGLAISYGVSILARYISPNIMFIAAIAMLAYGAVSAYQSYGTTGNAGLPYANEVMSLVPAVSKGAQSQLQTELTEITKQMEKNQENYQKQMKEIDDAMDALGNPNPNIDIDALINSAFFNLFEQPDEFFTRTLTMNPGVVTLDSIGGYVDYSLTLPTDLNSLRS